MRRLRWAMVLAAATLAVAAPAFALTVDYQVSGTRGEAGWYVGPVTVKWTVTGDSSSSNCDTKTLTQDTTGTPITCTATDNNGGTSTRTAVVSIDRTAPVQVGAAAARPPDSAGWYTSPIDLTWSGSDATSGIASCTTTTYSGPDGPSIAPAGTCTDRAGNVSAPAAFGLAFDATPPALTGVGASLSGTRATLRWTASPDVVETHVARQGAPVVGVPPGAHETTDGPLALGRTYTWTVTVRDAAGNAASATATEAIRIVRPLLHWRPSPKAGYYNLQLFRHGHKVLTAWPTKPHYTIPRTWRYHGRTRHLVLGQYRWYAWPGYGPRALRRYGGLVAQGRVRVRATATPAASR